MNKTQINKTQIATIVIYFFVVFLEAQKSYSTVFSVGRTMVLWPAMLAIFIGIIALVRGNVVGWGIHNRRVAIIVIIVSFVCFAVLNYMLIYLPVLFY